jgi:hypothetical protein
MLGRLGASAAQLSSLNPANALVRRTLWVTLATVVVASVVAAGITAWSNLPDFEWRLRPVWLGAAIVGFVVLQLSHAAIWHLILRLLRQDVALSRTRAIWCTTGLARYTPGGLLMPMMRVAVSESEGVPKRVCLASIVYETALVLTGAVAVGAYALVSAPRFADQSARYLLLVVPVVALVALHPRVFRRLADVALQRLGRERLPFAIPMTQVLALVGLYAATWVLAGASLFALIHGVHPIHTDNVLVVLGAPAIGMAAATVGFVLPGGLGAREAGVAALLSAAMPVSVAIGVAVAMRVVQLGVELACAVATPLIARNAR